jgi:hypothetical protein
VAPPLSGLAVHGSSNSPDHNAKGTQSGTQTSEEARRPPTACRHVVSGALSLPAQGCFSPVPHGTRSLSVTQESLALEGGPPSFTPDTSCRALLRISTSRPLTVVYRALTVSGAPSQGTSTGSPPTIRGSYNPVAPKGPGLGSARFARRYSGHLG